VGTETEFIQAPKWVEIGRPIFLVLSISGFSYFVTRSLIMTHLTTTMTIRIFVFLGYLPSWIVVLSVFLLFIYFYPNALHSKGGAKKTEDTKKATLTIFGIVIKRK
jgi:hypothetical protein